MSMKHVGIVGENTKVVVAYRTLPGDAKSALVIPTSPLKQTYHDELDSTVSSDQAQQAYELASILAVRKFSDGTNMLQSLHAKGNLQKVPTEQVTMQPSTARESWIKLDALNTLIAEQKGVSIEELALTQSGEPGKTEIQTVASVKDDTVLSDEDLAKKYRADADALYKEVQELRKKADELAPKTSAKKTAKSNA
jgi:hypothetical protein